MNQKRTPKHQTAFQKHNLSRNPNNIVDVLEQKIQNLQQRVSILEMGMFNVVSTLSTVETRKGYLLNDTELSEYRMVSGNLFVHNTDKTFVVLTNFEQDARVISKNGDPMIVIQYDNKQYEYAPALGINKALEVLLGQVKANYEMDKLAKSNTNQPLSSSPSIPVDSTKKAKPKKLKIVSDAADETEPITE